MESDTAVTRTGVSRSRVAATAKASAEPFASPVIDAAVSGLTPHPSRCVAVAPGRLDVMGGLADFTGALVLNKTIANHAAVAAQRRSEDSVLVSQVECAGSDGAAPLTISYKDFRSVASGSKPGSGALEGLSKHDWKIHAALAAVVELVRSDTLPGFSGGLAVQVSSSLSDLSDGGDVPAVVGATIAAVAGLFDAKVDTTKAASVCVKVENDWLGRVVGFSDALAVLGGEPGSLMQWKCDPCTPGDAVRAGGGWTLAGIDCGLVRADASIRRYRARVAALMGGHLIGRVVRHEGLRHLNWDGYLSRVSINDYVERFRDRLPTRLKGSDYLALFGETDDALTQIEPDQVYKVRSRTEHHIYEHARSCQFVECLSRGMAGQGERAFEEAGALMYASHWSYGQRCGLGCVQTDLLVKLLRRQGAQAGVFGAKTTGRGCGGLVAVLLRDDDRAMGALESAIEEYHKLSEHKATLLCGSLPGALISGVRAM